MDVSENSGTPQIIHFNRGFHYKPSILGYPYFWKHPYHFFKQEKNNSSLKLAGALQVTLVLHQGLTSRPSCSGGELWLSL